MASVLKVDTLTGVATAGSIAVTGEGNSTTTNLQKGLCKAWAAMDPNVLDESYNFSSLTDQGAGEFDYNFTSLMASEHFSATGAKQNSTTNSNCEVLSLFSSTTTSNTRQRYYENNTLTDPRDANVSVHGDLA